MKASEKAWQLQDLAAWYNDMGFQLLALLEEQAPHQNIAISPLSIAIALALVYNGAEGTTERALARLVNPRRITLSHFNILNRVLQDELKDPESEVTLAMANAIWVQEGVPLDETFCQRLYEAYQASPTALDFQTRADGAAETINAWVAQKTRDKIQKFLSAREIQHAIMVLTNALYFNGLWQEPFDPDATHERPFTLLNGARRPHPFMHRVGMFEYLESDLFQGVRLPFGSGRLAMYILVPREGCSFDRFRRSLRFEHWRQWIGCFSPRRGELALPRFRLSYRNPNLREALNQVAHGIIHGPDFLSMGASGPLIISRIVHQTLMEVNEKGTEAAAATAIIMARGLQRTPMFRMIVDRPFFCAIHDNHTGALLFVGFVLEPQT